MMMRAFFAIEIPKSLQDVIEQIILDLQTQLHDNTIRWIKPQHLHITLQFLAQIKVEDTLKLIENVSINAKKIMPFDIQLGSIELFPNPQQPKIISIHVIPNNFLSELSSSIGIGIHSTNYKTETRPFRGHLTIGRITAKHKNFILPEIKMPQLEKIYVKEIVFLRSEPKPTKLKYSLLKKISLANSKTTRTWTD